MHWINVIVVFPLKTNNEPNQRLGYDESELCDTVELSVTMMMNTLCTCLHIHCVRWITFYWAAVELWRRHRRWVGSEIKKNVQRIMVLTLNLTKVEQALSVCGCNIRHLLLLFLSPRLFLLEIRPIYACLSFKRKWWIWIVCANVSQPLRQCCAACTLTIKHPVKEYHSEITDNN